MTIEEKKKKKVARKAEYIYQKSIKELRLAWTKAHEDEDPVEGAYKLTEKIINHYDLEDFNEDEQQRIREIVEENAFNGLT